ncbi:Ldh family oxidoreductase [Yoonia sp.]|uniref:Ldh family oxidoreductase n=1 Tax=Yoonia sp. TaxID=2212373 RepID=UPI002FD8A812
MADTINLSIPEATSLLTQAFCAVGVPDAAAASVARALVAAEAEGQVGHGFSRLADYAAQVQSGKIAAKADVTASKRGPASLFVDAAEGFAYPALDLAFEAGVPLAREMGIALIAIGNSHHCGALSLQVERYAKAGLLAIMVANAPKSIAPWGAREPVFGTNPIAFATPAEGRAPLVIDLSLSKVARGKVMAAKKAGRPIPPNWALDVAGNPTTDAEAALKGTMIPIGEAKGTALALMVEILSAALTGSAFSREAGSFFDADGPAPRVGQTLIVIDPGGQSDYGRKVADLMAVISGLEGARLPGDRRRAAIARSHAEGIDVPAVFVDQARRLAKVP